MRRRRPHLPARPRRRRPRGGGGGEARRARGKEGGWKNHTWRPDEPHLPREDAEGGSAIRPPRTPIRPRWRPAHVVGQMGQYVIHNEEQIAWLRAHPGARRPRRLAASGATRLSVKRAGQRPTNATTLKFGLSDVPGPKSSFYGVFLAASLTKFGRFGAVGDGREGGRRRRCSGQNHDPRSARPRAP